MRDRIKEFRRIPAGELKANPRNWRVHPETQRAAWRAVLGELGFADAVLAYEHPEDGLVLIDGHMRVSEAEPGDMIPVLVLDLSETEAEKLLAILDALGAGAVPDTVKYAELLRDIETASGDLTKFLDEQFAELQVSLGRRDNGDAATPADEPAEYPIVPVFDEKYSYVLIVTKSQLEWNRLREIMKLEPRVCSYKRRSELGEGRIILFPQFEQMWNSQGHEHTQDHLPVSGPTA
jgi:hypothetical protein